MHVTTVAFPGRPVLISARRPIRVSAPGGLIHDWRKSHGRAFAPDHRMENGRAAMRKNRQATAGWKTVWTAEMLTCASALPWLEWEVGQRFMGEFY